VNSGPFLALGRPSLSLSLLTLDLDDRVREYLAAQDASKAISDFCAKDMSRINKANFLKGIVRKIIEGVWAVEDHQVDLSLGWDDDGEGGGGVGRYQ
jgi:hypothetical protein